MRLPACGTCLIIEEIGIYFIEWLSTVRRTDEVLFSPDKALKQCRNNIKLSTKTIANNRLKGSISKAEAANWKKLEIIKIGAGAIRWKLSLGLVDLKPSLLRRKINCCR